MSRSISGIWAREVIDSRGNPTVEVELSLADGSSGRAIVPSGASTGIHEALELRDDDKNRFLGKGVLQAVRNIEERIRPALLHKSIPDLFALDRLMLELDGTPQKKNLGANAILGVSLAFVHAEAAAQKRPLYQVLNSLMASPPMSLPVPLMNIINGGLHSDNGLEFQEFMIVPHGFATFSEALQAGCEVFHHLKEILSARHESTSVGDEGGFAPKLKSNEHALQIILEAIEKAGYAAGKEIALALDVAASSFFVADKYKVQIDSRPEQSSRALIDFYDYLAKTYPIVSIEDGLGEDDWGGWAELTQRLGQSTQLVGDDLFVTQIAHLRKGIESKCANAVLVKANQVGTLSETIETMALARKHNFRQVVSHRSGETEDVTIAHLAVGSGSGQIKTGSLSRGERTAKYNELLRIESLAKRNGNPLPFHSPFKT